MRALIVNPTIDRDLELYHLGTAGIASFLNAVGRHRAEVVDFTFAWDRWEDVLRERLERFRPQVLGISTVTPRMPSILRIARAAKQWDPKLVVVLGGHHASLDSEGTVRQDAVDYAVIGEGEYTFQALLDTLEDGGDVRAVPGVGFLDGDEYVETGIAPLPKGALLDQVPHMDWTLWEQHPRMIYHAGYVPIIGVRGCPYKCSFCSSPVLAQRLEDAGPFVRKRDATRVAEEAEYQWERHARDGLRYLSFYDQNFLMHRSWLDQFVRAYRERGLHTKLPFSVYSRVDHITEEKLELARSAGCVQLRLGIEAGDPTVRNNLLNKELDQEVLLEKLAMVKRSGIKTLGYFLIGTPGETAEQADASFRLAKEGGLDRAAFFYFTPLWNLQIMEKAGISVNYLEREKSATFYQGGELTEEASGLGKAKLKALFFRANGYFLARTIKRHLQTNAVDWVAGFPKYWAEARKDGLDAKLAISQYVYYHQDAYLV
ncbi:MAG: radical SAM protein [Pseudomonadota bacterium]|nr:radical SAM protein [Pseudomonadota bacterium]